MMSNALSQGTKTSCRCAVASELSEVFSEVNFENTMGKKWKSIL